MYVAFEHLVNATESSLVRFIYKFSFGLWRLWHSDRERLSALVRLILVQYWHPLAFWVRFYLLWTFIIFTLHYGRRQPLLESLCSCCFKFFEAYFLFLILRVKPLNDIRCVLGLVNHLWLDSCRSSNSFSVEWGYRLLSVFQWKFELWACLRSVVLNWHHPIELFEWSLTLVSKLGHKHGRGCLR